MLAMGFVDITGLDGVRTQGHEVVDVADITENAPELHRQLRLDERPHIEQVMIIKKANDRSVFRGKKLVMSRLHAEELILALMAYYGVPDRERLFTVYSDFSPCEARCDRKLPATTDRIFSARHGVGDYHGKMTRLLTEASQVLPKDPAFREELAAEKERKDALKEGNTKHRYETAAKANKVMRSGRGGHCGRHDHRAGLVLVPQAGAMGPECAESTATDTADTGLGKALAEPPSETTGGIDFSSLQLQYLADPGDGSGLQHAFRAAVNVSGRDLRPSSGLAAATQTSDAFFVWLSLHPHSFWVNLHPDEPDRIVDDQLGRTDAGRVLLEADLQMKKTVGKLIHPHTPLGKRYWDGIRGDCVSSRNWILPAPATVYQDDDKLYILDAPLDVKTETDDGAAAGAPSCLRQDQATEEHNEHLERTLLLPRLRKAINTAPEYAALRRVYLARVAAEWYRDLSLRKDTAYGELVNSGDITEWRITDGWKPRDTFDAHVDSYMKGEFKVTDRTTSGGTTYVRRYVYGGVDFTSVPLRELSEERFGTEFATLPASVDRSLRAPSVTGRGDAVWLGAPTPRQAVAGLGPAEKPVSAGTWAIRLLPALLVPFALLLWRRRRRLNTRSASPLRRAATGGGPRRRS
ncbi:hypothetical protein CP967_33580 [Streptomyces nitrosporeus]|uniref:Uncharacterized protein n=2 Tax=Streptomyces nitrosporeus TaxID=28894 RepID=A0A5J6FIU1_9ACTN|nr:hypothetical protein CP967_33580 [Streptomyces nitrosporeus]